MTSTTEDMGWEKLFQETLKNRMRVNNDSPLRYEVPWIMDFIRTQIAAAYQQGQENMKAKAVGTIPNALRMVEESLRWGDSDYHSNSVRVGYNQAIEVIADRLNALPVSKEKEA